MQEYPAAPMTWPCSMRSPIFTSMRDMCRKFELTPWP
jgi:hypothetical protein